MKNLLSKNIITPALLLIWLLILIFFPNQIEENRVYAAADLPEPKSTSFSSLFPENYKYPEKVTSSPTPTVTPKPTSIPKPVPTQKPKAFPEKISSTIKVRDEDRVLYFGILRDQIEEYYFHFDQMPNLYSNKSEKLLSSELSDSIYLYNGKDNKTNALGLKIIDNTYLFNQVEICEENFSLENKISFLYNQNNFEITLCKESREKFTLKIEN